MTLNKKRILVTGSCGTVGSELVRALLQNPKYKVEDVVGIDNNESELFFQDQRFIHDPRAKFILADVRDQSKLNRILHETDIVFHAAGLKHVVVCERSPMEAVQTNINGVQNIIQAAKNNDVERVIFTSSDKAVNPTNVMGTSKLMGERLMTAANSNTKLQGSTIFTSTRFGNVLGSRGSVIPIFRKQIEEGGPVTITHPEMTRFVMTIEEAVRLVIDSATLARGGEVMVTKMPVARVVDIADVMIQELAPEYGFKPDDIKIDVIGTKPGEKLYEELMSSEETRRATELPLYFSILPAFRGFYRSIDYRYAEEMSTTVNNPYNSANEKSMTKNELRNFLIEGNLLEFAKATTSTPNEDRRYWPGDREEKGN